MSRENAEANLKELGTELGIEGLKFDENNTCILGIDDKWSMHVTYEPNSNRLYIYSPILDGLPDNDGIRLKLFTKLLEGSMLGGQMAGGGAGVALNEGLILLHCTIDMVGAPSGALRAFAPLYVETIEKWRKVCEELAAGRETSVDLTPGAPPPGQEGGDKGPQQGPGEGFIRA